ncbi:MAG: RNA 2'-phosphotransferase [Acidobacteria bacterium]|nr:RNA 2'-phosphotransferase [Acidobacteriota bacterium]
MEKRLIKISKFLSLVLRHQPEEIGLQLDPAGWVSVNELLRACRAKGFAITTEELQEVVRDNDKQRFTFNDDHSLIRANQGHSIEVELEYAPQTPPAILYHGTATRFVNSIQAQGLLKGKRLHVHLSPDEATAIKVGSRHGQPVVLKIAALRMHEDGLKFYLSKNGVWLTATVPADYIIF